MGLQVIHGKNLKENGEYFIHIIPHSHNGTIKNTCIFFNTVNIYLLLLLYYIYKTYVTWKCIGNELLNMTIEVTFA